MRVSRVALHALHVQRHLRAPPDVGVFDVQAVHGDRLDVGKELVLERIDRLAPELGVHLTLQIFRLAGTN